MQAILIKYRKSQYSLFISSVKKIITRFHIFNTFRLFRSSNLQHNIKCTFRYITIGVHELTMTRPRAYTVASCNWNLPTPETCGLFSPDHTCQPLLCLCKTLHMLKLLSLEFQLPCVDIIEIIISSGTFFVIFFFFSTAGSSKLDKEPPRVSASTQRPLSPCASFFVHLTHAEGGGLTESDHMSHRPQPLPLQAAGPEIWEFPYRNQWWLYCCRSHP